MDAVIETATEVDDIEVRLDDTDANADHTLSIDLCGESVRRLFVDWDDGNKAFTLSDGRVDQFLAYLGGDNSLSLAGTIEGSLSYAGRDGNDAVTLADSAIVERNVDSKLGGGDNSVSHQGAIGGNLRVVSANEDDVVDVSDREDAVGGRTMIDLGGQHDGRGPCGPHGRGTFGFPLGKMLARAFGFGRWGR